MGFSVIGLAVDPKAEAISYSRTQLKLYFESLKDLMVLYMVFFTSALFLSFLVLKPDHPMNFLSAEGHSGGKSRKSTSPALSNILICMF